MTVMTNSVVATALCMIKRCCWVLM